MSNRDNQKRIVDWAVRMITANALILDTETTGLDESDQVVEIALIDACETMEFQSFVKPSRPIPDAATAIHGITNGMVESARIWPSFFFPLQWIVLKRPVLAYNAEFDSRILAQSDRIYRNESQPWEWHCLMQAWMEFHGLRRWQRLENVCYEIGVPVGGHRALGDAKAAREVLRWLAKQEAGK